MTKFHVPWSTISRNEIVRVCSIYLLIYSLFDIKTAIPYFDHNQCCRRRSDRLSERRLEQANLITKEKLPILKKSQNKPQTINDFQLISHLIAYNIACF